MDEYILRDELLEQESVSPELRAKYEQEVKKMIEQPLTPFGRAAWIMAAVGGLAFFFGFGWIALTMPAELPILARLGFIAGSFFGLGWAALGIYIAKRKRVNMKIYHGATFGLVWVFMVIMMVIFLMLGSQMEDAAKGNQMMLSGLVFFVMFAIPAFVQQLIVKSEYSTREQMLKLELQIAELAEKLESKK